jgi:hypothetical protein
MTAATPVPPDLLPAPVRRFLAAHAARDTGTALALLRPDAVVVDDGRTYRGTEEVLGFLRRAGSEFSYTSELVAARRVDDTGWVAVHHLEGDFPGGQVDLEYRFVLDGDLIAQLVIAA